MHTVKLRTSGNTLNIMETALLQEEESLAQLKGQFLTGPSEDSYIRVSDVFGEEAGIHQDVNLDDLTANRQDGGCLLKLGSTIKSMRTLNSCSVKGGSSFKWQKKELNSTARCLNTML